MIVKWRQEIAEEKIIEISDEYDYEYDYLENAAKEVPDETHYGHSFTQGFFVVEDNLNQQQNNSNEEE